MIKKGAKWGRKCARKSEKIQRRPIIVFVDVPGIQIDKSIAQTKKNHPESCECGSKRGTRTIRFSLNRSSFACLTFSLSARIDSAFVRCCMVAITERVCFCAVLRCVAERKNGRLGCTSEKKTSVLSTERKYASGMVLVLNIINKINGFGVLNPESASHS
jgi:hypothetical protein